MSETAFRRDVAIEERPMRRCPICIRPLERIYGNQKTCGSPRCQQLLKEWRKLQKRGWR